MISHYDLTRGFNLQKDPDVNPSLVGKNSEKAKIHKKLSKTQLLQTPGIHVSLKPYHKVEGAEKVAFPMIKPVM